MKNSTIREKVLNEVQLIPEEKLPQILDLIHHFRLGLQSKKKRAQNTTSYAGCWRDMPEEIYQGLLSEIRQRRDIAFSRRRDL